MSYAIPNYSVLLHNSLRSDNRLSGFSLSLDCFLQFLSFVFNLWKHAILSRPFCKLVSLDNIFLFVLTFCKLALWISPRLFSAVAYLLGSFLIVYIFKASMCAYLPFIGFSLLCHPLIKGL